MRAEVVPWWEQAQANLATARVNAAAGIHYAASWFAQQAAKLAVKALYIGPVRMRVVIFGKSTSHISGDARLALQGDGFG